MNPEVLIVREIDGYRILHGHLHLASLLSMSDEAEVEAVSEGKMKVVRTSNGIWVEGKRQCVPFLKT
jgi:hypothetical protein